MISFKVYDNNGKSWDRYTVIIKNDVYGMSHNAQSPNGFNQYNFTIGENGELNTEGIGKDLSDLEIYRLPEEVKKAIENRANDYNKELYKSIQVILFQPF